MNTAPQSIRRHIAIFGRRNVGKSSLLNAITGQQVAIVSPEAGTTTDPVNRAMELHPLGPCLFIDTAGFDDEGQVGELRNARTRRVLEQADMAIVVLDQTTNLDLEKAWMGELRRLEIPTVLVLNKADRINDEAEEINRAARELGMTPVVVSATAKHGLEALRDALARAAGDNEPGSLTGNLAKEGDLVLLVMPQDPQAPRGRLILPQVQTLRDLLDKHCRVMCCDTASLKSSLDTLCEPPALIITDSQVFKQVQELTPAGTRLTSFSVLMAGNKGNLEALVEGAHAISKLTATSRVLIAEACTHAPMSEDIGRVKIPRLIKKRFGDTVQVEVHAGKDYPADLSQYDLIIHCGACMFNRKLMLSRIRRAREQGVPITNYGLAIAQLQGILGKVALP